MAKLKAVRIGKTINRGNYESLRVDVELEPKSHETLDDVVTDANALIDYIADAPDAEALAEAERVLNVRRIVRKYQ